MNNSRTEEQATTTGSTLSLSQDSVRLMGSIHPRPTGWLCYLCQ